VSEDLTQRRHVALFPSFFQAGFESSTHVNRRGERQDLTKLTQHDRFLAEDYQRVKSLGLLTVREGVPWYRVDRKGRYNFRPVAPFIDEGLRQGLTQIWDLFHYGFPTYLDPFSPDFVPRFADYCYAFARYLLRRTGNRAAEGTRFYTPVNEPSFYAWAGGEVGWFAPFERGRGFDLKLQLAQAAIAGINAIRAADPGARFVNVDPVCHTVAPADEPELAEDAALFNTFQWQAWDILSGKEWPQFGGSPAHLDIIGVNYYLSGQWEHCRGTTLPYDDPRRRPFREMLMEVAARYPGHPILITETGCWGELRPRWLRDIVTEVLAALEAGLDIQGICLYPIIDMPDWHGGHFMEFGMWDLVPDGDTLKRVLYRPFRDELLRQRQRLDESGLLPVPPTAAPAERPVPVIGASKDRRERPLREQAVAAG
jgi:beta-glucosidase/6-phospho-beta-glucosidase/beta-galactosidase